MRDETQYERALRLANDSFVRGLALWLIGSLAACILFAAIYLWV